MSRPQSPAVLSRREAVARTLAWASGVTTAALLPRPLHALASDGRHPDPRPGITADAVLADHAVPEEARKAYGAARDIPAIFDGLRCHCECATRDGLRSLLSCFETKMPITCGTCRNEAELAHAEFLRGRTLAQIRKSVDKRFG
jgi:hypothetical protein